MSPPPARSPAPPPHLPSSNNSTQLPALEYSAPPPPPKSSPPPHYEPNSPPSRSRHRRRPLLPPHHRRLPPILLPALTAYHSLRPHISSRHAARPRSRKPLTRPGRKPPQLFADPLDNLQLAPLNTTDDVRLVYLIGVGARPFAHLVASRLLYALYSPVHLFLIHIDVKADKAAAQAMYTLAKQHNSNVRVLQARRLVQWGMFSMVSPFLDALHTHTHRQPIL